MEFYPFIKDCLMEFNYPNVHSMSDEEVIDVLSKDNRQFLVCWYFKQLGGDFEELSKEELGDVLCTHSFCSPSEKDSFMEGPLNNEKQLTILNVMFKFLKDFSEDNEAYVEKTSIESSCNIDLNLFPTCGNMRVLGPKGRAKKIKEFKNEEKILLDLLEKCDSTVTSIQSKEELKTDLRKNLEELKTLLTADFQKKAFEMVVNKENVSVKKISLNNDFIHNINVFLKEISVIQDVITNTNIITNFGDQTDPILKSDQKYNNMLRSLSQMCANIIKLKNQ